MEVSEGANIVITGFMGVGKSEVGWEVARRLGREFVDMDALIEERVGMTIPEIFAQRGEGFFLISYRVDDVDDALAELKAKGRQTIDEKPRELMGNRYAFIHRPKELSGVLTELLDGEFRPED